MCRSRVKIGMSLDPVAILFDRSTRGYARILESASTTLLDPSTSQPLANKLAGSIPIHPRADKQFVAEQRGAILAIARAAKKGQLRVYASRILHDEGFRIAKWPEIASELDIFANVGVREFEWLKLTIDVAKIWPVYEKPSEKHLSYVQNFCD